MLEMMRNFFCLTPAIAATILSHEYARFITARKFEAIKPEWGEPGFIRRIDPVGLLMYYFFKFGWSRPFPVNYWKLRKAGYFKAILTSISGSIANFSLGLIVGLLFYLSGLYQYSTFLPDSVSSFPTSYIADVVYWTMVINLNTALFNLIPIPPLDGANIVTVLVPESQVNWLVKYELYGILTLLVLSLMGIIQLIMWPITQFIQLLARLIA
ncbi:site-2 protease family protein [Mesotoga sp.]|jgi:Zn-dependent protease|uniref:Site-2 protease family protein n=3 Tax=Mesotoga infera TaxID=1236046 RepID=A0A3D3TN82_9BACT|nr:site-2 protease family protein [Mesotoga infera]